MVIVPLLWIALPVAVLLAAFDCLRARDWAALITATVLLALASCFIALALPGGVWWHSNWSKFIESRRGRLQAAEAWFRSLPSSTERKRFADRDLPAEVRGMASGGQIEVRIDENGVRWLGIPIVCYGIDDCKVLIFSGGDAQPGEAAWGKTTDYWPMGGGWFLARTT